MYFQENISKIRKNVLYLFPILLIFTIIFSLSRVCLQFPSFLPCHPRNAEEIFLLRHPRRTSFATAAVATTFSFREGQFSARSRIHFFSRWKPREIQAREIPLAVAIPHARAIPGLFAPCNEWGRSRSCKAQSGWPIFRALRDQSPVIRID